MVYQPITIEWDVYVDFGGGCINIWSGAPDFIKDFVYTLWAMSL